MASLEDARYGGLHCLEKKPSSYEATIVVLHGYGASETDFAPIANFMNLESPVRWIFPRAPLSIALAPGLTGYAWFPIDVAALDEAIRTQSFRDFEVEKMSGFHQAVEALTDFLKEAEVERQNLILSGFSQGAMLATELALQEEPLRALSILSGTYVKGLNWKERASRKSQLPIFQTHGRSDPILPYSSAEALYRDFLNAGCQIQFHGFEGGHELPPPLLSVWAQFLEKHSRRS